jgi:hypothetical protein
MLIKKKDNTNNFNSIKRQRLQRKISQKINIIENKINLNNFSEDNLILLNKVKKLKKTLKLISMTPKEKNRYKEVKRIDLRIKEYKRELELFDNHINFENIKILKIKSKISKLTKRQNILENHAYLKKNTRRIPALIRFNLRKTRITDDIIA